MLDQIDWINDLEVILTGVATALVISASVVWIRTYRKGAERQQWELVREAIAEYTKQIQPGANGGLSLSDLHRKFDQMYERQTQIIDDVNTLKEAVVLIENDMEGIE